MNVYFDKSLIQQEYLSFLSPFLGVPSFSIWWEDPQQIKQRHDYCKQSDLLTLESEESCDYYVYPKYFRLDNFDELKVYSNKALRYGKKVLVFSYWEIDEYIDVNSNIVRFKRSTNVENPWNEYCLPPFPQNLLQMYNNKITYIDESEDKKYSIGFTGYSTYHDFRSWIYYLWVRIVGVILRNTWLKKILIRYKSEKLYWRLVNAGIGNYCRGESISYIKKLPQYRFNFIQRSHALTLDATTQLRDEYIENMNNSDFSLVVRWFGNYSFRQYEAMSLGKIVVYIDTRAKLPFQSEIPYNKLFIIIPFNDIANIWNYLDGFVMRNKWSLNTIQDQIRSTYESHFLMKNYYTKLITILESKMNKL